MNARRLTSATLVSLCALVGAFALSAAPALAGTPPAIEEESVMEAAATSATLQAQINPEGSETTYRFEYGTSEAYVSSIPVPDGLVGSGSAGVTVSVHIQGLSANTGYHYRVVASVPSRGETVDGADGTFTTQRAGGAFTLPDGREWELVSPPNKHGGLITGMNAGGDVIQAAEDGSAMTYTARAPTELEPQGYSESVQVFSKRGPQGGWSSNDISTPHSERAGGVTGNGTEYRFFSSDLSLGLVQPFGSFTKLAPEETERTPDIRHDSTCEAEPASCYTPLVTAANVPPGTKFDASQSSLGNISFEDATPDLSHVILSENWEPVALTSEGTGLYEWTAGHLQVVSILPEAEGGTVTEGGIVNADGNLRHALSNDGSRIVWRGPTKGNDENEAYLYLRDTVKGETLRLPGTLPFFQDANSDDSRIFFDGENGLEVCEVKEVGGKLACDMTTLAPEINRTMIGASEDGSYVYFASEAALAPGAVAGNCEEEPATLPASSRFCNLYMVHNNGTTWEAPKLVAVLSDGDAVDWYYEIAEMTARVSPDGHWLTFMSQRSLTGYDNRDVVSGKPDEEVYLYNAETGKIVCASCDPTGARPTGAEAKSIEEGFVLGGGLAWESSTWLAASIHGWTPYRLNQGLYQSRYLSDSGRLFFDTPEALVPQDVNGTWDVYEFEPAGVGGCTASSVTFNPGTGGCVGLISAGTSPEQSGFLEASSNGDNVFFLTTSRLSSEDFDAAFDVYDAHVCSGATPCYTPAEVPPPCSTGDGCKAAPSPQPAIFGAPSSATFSGAGNVNASSVQPVAAPRSLTAAQKLARALKGCRKEPRKKRGACKQKARARYRAEVSRNGKSMRKGNR